MSTLAVFFEEKKITIVNDSLAYDGDTPASFHSKTKTYPHLRCAVNCMGSHLLHTDFELLIKDYVLSDFSSLVQLLEHNLYDFLNIKFRLGFYDKYKSPDIAGRKSIGSILLMGYSEFDKKMSAHTFYVYKDGVDYVKMDISGKYITHPKLTQEDEQNAFLVANSKRSEDKREAFLIEILKIFYANYRNRVPGIVPSGLVGVILKVATSFYPKWPHITLQSDPLISLQSDHLAYFNRF